MALRTLAARMRTPAAAAALRLSPAPRVSPPVGTVQSFFTSFSFEGRGRWTRGEDVKMLYRGNLKILKDAKKHERDMNKRIRSLNVGSKFLKWSFWLVLPLPLTATVLKVTH